MTQKSPESIVEAFANIPIKTKCKTCSHPKLKEINRACSKFSEMKMNSETSHSWRDFHQYVIVPNYDYKLSVWSMRNHIKNCLGL